MKTVLITGASGFVGSNLVPYLEKLQANIFIHPYGQSINPLIPCSVDAVIHLGGKAHDLKNNCKWEDYYHGNFEYTKNLFDSFLQSEAGTFIFISTVKAAADHIDDTLSEDYVPNPKTFYGKSKLMAEEYIQSKQLPRGKKYFILRPCMIHGPGNRGNLNLLYNFISKRIPYPLASFDNKRSFLSVENLCSIIKDLLETDIPPGVYNVADDEPLSTKEVVLLLSDAINVHPALLYIPRKVVKGAAKIGDFLHLPLNSERLRKLTESYVVSNRKIKEVLKKELPVSSREGIMRTALSFKKN